MQKILIIVLSNILLTSITLAQDHGQKLYQAKCIECHSRMTGGEGEVIYERKNSIVSSLAELNQRVTHCAEGANTGWSQEEIKSVTEYLNQQHYHF